MAAIAVRVPASPAHALEAMDTAQQAALGQEFVRLQAQYLSPENTVPGLGWDPDGDPARAAAAGGASAAGDVFPLDHRLMDSNGAAANLRQLLQQGPLIVVFFRGLALRHLSQCLPVLRQLYGANVVAISGQLPSHNHKCEAANHLVFPVLCDKGLALAQSLGICYTLTQQEARFYDFICEPDLEGVYGAGHSLMMPLPATFVLERVTGRIGYAFVDQDLSKRSRLLRIESALQDLTVGDTAAAASSPAEQQRSQQL